MAGDAVCYGRLSREHDTKSFDCGDEELLLGRLAVDVGHQSQGLGRHMLRDAILRSQHLSSLSGCRCLLVDAYATAAPWYERFGFAPIEETQPARTVRLYLDLRRLSA